MANVPLVLGDPMPSLFPVARDGDYEVVVGCRLGAGKSMPSVVLILADGSTPALDAAALVGAGAGARIPVRGFQSFRWSLNNAQQAAQEVAVWITLRQLGGAPACAPPLTYELQLPAHKGEIRMFHIERV